ncbi:MAG: response regulator [Clostridiales bacterium]|nr:response regulator [Clostridiales bacterium]
MGVRDDGIRNIGAPQKGRLTVLVVDDSGFSRNFLIDILNKEGYTVIGQAGDGREAVELALRHKPDLIFMDINMPNMDGLEATRLILKEAPEMVIIMCSAFNRKAVTTEALKIGAKAFVVKPYKKGDITKAIDSSLRSTPIAQVIPFTAKDKFGKKEKGNKGSKQDNTDDLTALMDLTDETGIDYDTEALDDVYVVDDVLGLDGLDMVDNEQSLDGVEVIYDAQLLDDVGAYDDIVLYDDVGTIDLTADLDSGQSTALISHESEGEKNRESINEKSEDKYLVDIESLDIQDLIDSTYDLIESLDAIVDETILSDDNKKEPGLPNDGELTLPPVEMEDDLQASDPSLEILLTITSVAGNHQKIVIDEKTSDEDITIVLKDYIGNSDQKSLGLEYKLSIEEVMVVSAIMDLERKSILRAFLDGYPYTQNSYDYNKIWTAMYSTSPTTQWLVHIVNEIIGSYDPLSQQQVQNIIDNLVIDGTLVCHDGFFKLPEDIYMLANRLIIIDNILSITAPKEDASDKVFPSRLIAIQSGLHDILSVECHDKDIIFKTVSPKELIKSVGSIMDSQHYSCEMSEGTDDLNATSIKYQARGALDG